MKSPFVFGKIALGRSFINRKEEIKRLSDNFQNQVNCILISPRRWGKSSLVVKTATTLKKSNSNIKFCFLDLFRIRTEEEFYKKYATEVVKSSSNKIEEWINNAKAFLGRLSPTISFSADPVNDFQLGFNALSRDLVAEEILNLPEKLAKKKKIKIVVCIDEFQNIGNYAEPVAFQKTLRSVWQYHHQTSYCLYGSKRHMMMELFEAQSMPFYKFGDVIFLQKIKGEHFNNFIQKSFTKTGKLIDQNLSWELINTVDTHPYFVQQLAHITWNNTDNSTTKKILNESITGLIEQNAILYQQITSGLSNTQLNFLIALSKGETTLGSLHVMHKYSLGTSGNVSKIKKVLFEKEIIDISNGRILFLDPVYRLWLQNNFSAF
jgi:hypothetical protein